MLTECLPASSEDPVRDLSGDPVKQSPSLGSGGQNTVHQPPFSEERISFGGLPQTEQIHFIENDGLKERVALLLTEFEVRVIPRVEAQELSRTTGGALQTLTVSPRAARFSEIQLSRRPLVVHLEEEQTVREAYRLLLSLLESPKPVPKPRKGSSSQAGQQSSLVEALRRGVATGNRVLTLGHGTETETPPEARQVSVNETMRSDRSGDTEQNRRRTGEDVRRSTYKRLDSLEETIRELEKTLIEISGHSTVEQLYSEITARSPASAVSETRKPPVPPKPSSLSPPSIQVHADSRSDAACSTFPLHCFSVGDCWNFTFRLLMSAPRLNRHLIAFIKSKKKTFKEGGGDRQQISSLLVCSVISAGAAILLSSRVINCFSIDPPWHTFCLHIQPS